MGIISFIEDRQIIQAILKHLGLWLVKSRSAPKAYAPPALNQNGSGGAGYVLDHFLKSPCTTLTFLVTASIPGTITFSRNKEGESGA